MKELLLQEINTVGLDFPFLLFAMSNCYVPGTLFSFSAWKEGRGRVGCGICVFTAQALAVSYPEMLITRAASSDVKK